MQKFGIFWEVSQFFDKFKNNDILIRLRKEHFILLSYLVEQIKEYLTIQI